MFPYLEYTVEYRNQHAIYTRLTVYRETSIGRSRVRLDTGRSGLALYVRLDQYN